MLPTVFLHACKNKLPTTPTVVTGKIVDKNGNPLEGAGLRLTGRKIEGYTGGYPTFSITVDSDQDANYELSQLVPKDTDQISNLPRSTDKVPSGNQGYAHYIFLDGSYVQLGAPYFIPYSEWGKTTTLNYQYI